MRSRILSFSISFLTISLTVAPAWAQETRVGEITQRQAEKASRLQPNVPGKGERFLNWLQAHADDPNTVYLTFGGLYPSAGFAPGVALRHAFGHARFNTGIGYSVRSYKMVQASLDFPELADDHLEIGSRVRWTDATQVPFYGVGNDTSKDDRVAYGLKRLDAGVSATFKPLWWTRVGGGVAYNRYEDREGAGSRPSIETIESFVPGLFSEARYTHASAFAAIDWRESGGYSRRGGLYSVTLNDYKDSNDTFGFRRIDAEVQQFVPLLKEQWVLAFRALVQTTEAQDNELVPYYLLPTLGGARRHRGYSDFRFQDRHLMVLSGEYRWLPSRVVDMALFFDAGKVTHDRSDLDFDGLKTAFGIGFRVHGPNITPVRIDVAHGREGLRVHLTGGIPF